MRHVQRGLRGRRGLRDGPGLGLSDRWTRSVRHGSPRRFTVSRAPWSTLNHAWRPYDIGEGRCPPALGSAPTWRRRWRAPIRHAAVAVRLGVRAHAWVVVALDVMRARARSSNGPMRAPRCYDLERSACIAGVNGVLVLDTKIFKSAHALPPGEGAGVALIGGVAACGLHPHPDLVLVAAQVCAALSRAGTGRSRSGKLKCTRCNSHACGYRNSSSCLTHARSPHFCARSARLVA